MSETRLSVRVDSATKRDAEAVFSALGMTLSTGINVFLARVVQSRSIPFALELDADPKDARMRGAVRVATESMTANGAPVARFDDMQNRPYLEYPDGRRVYDPD
ncbi:MAG: type II toxin-antitoxin system RelB/DinJ family antitoxin [Methylobacteriaceae bacterium]|jgi:DNA-damage-inducible protein J|nr:type II toxin-antitoxin system RelB/DinJ family antitoxin [Methylobacteriaceae bacterium]